MLEEIFGVAKPVIGMVQLKPLPGSYRYAGESLESIIEAALSEADLLANAGFHGFQLQNMGDNPSSRHVGPETVAYVTSAALALRQAFPQVSLSILVNWDAEASIAVADAVGADFVRIEHTYTGVSVTSWGLSEACCHEATRFHAKIGARTKIFADVFEPNATPLAPKPLEQAAKETVQEGGADGIFVTGNSISQSVEWLKVARQAVPHVPIFLGGGATPENVAEALSAADGVAVATWIKGGDMRNPVDPKLAQAFMDAVRRAVYE
jgi:uncharacterized protein